ncbi:hypothetical protein DIE15_17490 [Burkholderia sp. Bp9031]|nr:hypothetical protein DIE15_17490 [Burkholderia sp. Bp9031]
MRPATHRNWVGIYARGAQPTKGNDKSWASLPKSTGLLLFSPTTNTALASGRYDAWLLFDDGFPVRRVRDGAPVPVNVGQCNRLPFRYAPSNISRSAPLHCVAARRFAVQQRSGD